MSWKEAAESLREVLNSAFSVAGFAPPAVKTYVGWPITDIVLKDVRTKPVGTNAHVGIYAVANGARNTSRYITDPTIIKVDPQGQIVDGPVALTLEFLGPVVEDELFIVVVNQTIFPYQVQPGDDLDTIIDAIAALINTEGTWAGSNNSGSFPGQAVLGVAGSPPEIYNLTGQVFGSGIAKYERARIERDLIVTIWASDAATREKLATQAILSINKQEFLDGADGCKIRVLYANDGPTDLPMPSGIMRHDIEATIEYPIVETVTGLARVANLLIDVKPLCISPVEAGIVYQLRSPSVLDQTSHSHVYESPSGSRPGSVFTLTAIPRANSLQLLHNLLPQAQKTVGATLGVNEFYIVGDTVTMGNTVGASDDLKARYEV